MTNWQLYILAGLPTATGLASIAVALILNGRMEARLDNFRAEILALRTKMEGKLTGLRSELISRIDRISVDQKQFYMILGEHKGKIDSFEKR